MPEPALLAALGPGNKLAMSQDVEDEYREVLARPKFDRIVTRQRRQELLDLVMFAAERFHPNDLVTDCADPSDNRYLALALACAAAAIVSVDEKHLLPMSPWRGIPILRPAEFVMGQAHPV